ncbi:MAG: flavin reductase family protein [Herminiimonas sp.]|nr:flavin reductase family protein [Herminiimonas sp.]
MLIDFSALDARTAYFWMASTITPRPVAWVSTCSASGVTNLAPFSFFQMITPAPPTLMISPLLHPGGALKDTARNIQETGEFVVNLVPFSMVNAMNASSFSFGADESEIERCNIATLASDRVRAPRVADVAVSFECRLASMTAYPAIAPSCHIILGEVMVAHIDQKILGPDGQIDPDKLDLVSRMGADWYGRTGDEVNFTLQRPQGWDRPAKS